MKRPWPILTYYHESARRERGKPTKYSVFQFPAEFQTGHFQNMRNFATWFVSLGATDLKVPRANTADDTGSLITTPAP